MFPLFGNRLEQVLIGIQEEKPIEILFFFKSKRENLFFVLQKLLHLGQHWLENQLVVGS